MNKSIPQAFSSTLYFTSSNQQDNKTYRLTEKQQRYQKLKRPVDFVIAFLALLVLAVPFLLVAILQKLSSPKEPIFFWQKRVGQNGRLFYVTKFRSMKSNAPKYVASNAFDERDAYISRLGRFLRNTSIDELPQLIQVLTGKMSLIGPRPLIQQEEEIHLIRQRTGVYQLRPGITGWAQVNGRDRVTDAEKAAFDYQYLKGLGLRMDLRIFWLTVKKVLGQTDIHENSGDLTNEPQLTVSKKLSIRGASNEVSHTVTHFEKRDRA